MLSFPNINYCGYMKGLDGSPFFRDAIGFIKTLDLNFWDICSAPGEYKVANVSFYKSAVASKFPPGEYRNVIGVFDDIDDNVFNATYYTVTGSSVVWFIFFFKLWASFYSQQRSKEMKKIFIYWHHLLIKRNWLHFKWNLTQSGHLNDFHNSLALQPAHRVDGSNKHQHCNYFSFWWNWNSFNCL